MSLSPIIIDCDPGHDDAVALLMALAATDIVEVVGVTTVAGNTDARQAQRNARVVCDLAGRTDLPVVAGCARPLVLPFRDASDFHGATGMDGFPDPLPPPGLPAAHAVDFLIEALRSAAEPLTLVCLAPLTNIAMALVKAPDIVASIREIVFMGGARRTGGNVTPCATFNLVCDPHAGHVVFESGCPLSVVSLDATAQVVPRAEGLARLRSAGTPSAEAAFRMLSFFDKRRMEIYGYAEAQTSLNDPCVIAYLLDRSLFGGLQAHIAIEHRSDLTMGMSVVDLTGRTSRPPNARWVDEADGARVLDLLVEVLGAPAP